MLNLLISNPITYAVMTPEDKLQRLVQSLTSAEERYVHIFASKHMIGENNKYLRLFRNLQGKDKSVIQKEKTKEQAGPFPPSAKNYLYRFILKAMRSFHEERTVDMKLKELLINSTLLYQKQLFDLSEDELQKTRELALRYERWAVLLECLFLETKVLIEHHPKEMLKRLEELHTEIERVFARLTEEWSVMRKQQNVFALTRKQYNIRHEDLLKHLPLPVAADTGGDLFNTQYYKTFTSALLYTCTANYDAAVESYETLIGLWEKFPHRIEEESSQFKRNIANYLVICNTKGKLHKIPSLLERIRSIPCRFVEEEAEQFQNVQYAELLFLMNTDGYDRLEEFVSATEKGLKRFKSKINKARELAFYYNISIAYFVKHEWKTAHHWMMRIIDQPPTEHRVDIQYFARLFRLILYYEMDKHDLLDYELVNVERYLRQRKAWFTYEATIVKFLKRQLDSATKHREAHFERFLSQLTEVSKQKGEASLPGCAELMLWSRHHISGVSIRKLLQKEVSGEAEVENDRPEHPFS